MQWVASYSLNPVILENVGLRMAKLLACRKNIEVNGIKTTKNGQITVQCINKKCTDSVETSFSGNVVWKILNE